MTSKKFSFVPKTKKIKNQIGFVVFPVTTFKYIFYYFGVSYGCHHIQIYILWFCLIFFFQVKRSLGQFTPAYWDRDEWHPLSGPLRFIQILGLVIIILTVELNAFFLKYCLWVPPSNPLNVYRLVIWWLIANPAIREYNAYLQDRSLSIFLL